MLRSEAGMREDLLRRMVDVRRAKGIVGEEEWTLLEMVEWCDAYLK